MAIKDVIKTISTAHQYKVTGGYWARIGSMRKKYGEDILIKSIQDLPTREIPLTHMLNIIERKCQSIIENGGEIDELTNDLLNLM